MKDSLGDRIKDQYETRTKYFLPRRTYTIIRLDGKAFHQLTKNMKRPFDEDFVEIMDRTAQALCKEIQGCAFGYVQSDEISLLLTDFTKTSTSAWYDGNIQKIASVSASIATAYFNHFRLLDYFNTSDLGQRKKGVDRHFVDGTDVFNVPIDISDIFNYLPEVKDLGMFDSRVFTIPDPVEVVNYFIWRQKDAIRNSVSSVAQSLYSHKELNGKNTDEMQEMIFEKGQNWNDIDPGFKRGRMVTKENYTIPGMAGEAAIRSRWVSNSAIWITKNRDDFNELIPIRGY